MSKRDLLTLSDLTNGEIEHLLKRTFYLKERSKKGVTEDILKGKTLVLFFEKPSTRTRVSFEAGIYQMGGHAIFLQNEHIQINRGETIRDTARAISRYADGIIIRTFEQRKIKEWANYSDIPVINGLTDAHHPCQALADLFTILEKKGKLSGLKLAYVGDGNNVANSLIEGCAKAGMDIAVASPVRYEPDEEIVKKAMEEAKTSGSRIDIVREPESAVTDADVIYTDVWVSMGQEEEHEKRVKIFKPYQVNKELVQKAKDDVLIMHCLPAHRGEEITDEVIEGKNSVVFDQAENRLHVQKAIMELLILGLN